MSILFRRGPAAEERALPTFSASTWAAPAGFTADTMGRALRLAPVFAAVGMVTDTLVTVPLHGYRDSTDAGSSRLPTEPAVIADPALHGVDALAWRGQYVASMMLRGNAYGYTARTDSLGRPTKVHWLHPDSVSVLINDGQVEYRHNGQELDTARITHIRWVTLPGDVVGLNPIELFRRNLLSAEYAADSQGNFYRNGGPAAHFRNTAAPLTAEQADTVKARFNAGIKSGGLLVTGNEWEYKTLGVSAADAQFIEAAKFTANEIAAIYKLPPEEIGGDPAGGSLTYSTLEMNDLKYIRKGVLPWAVRLERAITSWLPNMEYAKFNLDAYVRTDLVTRMNAHTLALAAGLETLDEGRALEDRAPLTPDELDFWQQNFRKTTVYSRLENLEK